MSSDLGEKKKQTMWRYEEIVNVKAQKSGCAWIVQLGARRPVKIEGGSDCEKLSLRIFQGPCLCRVWYARISPWIIFPIGMENLWRTLSQSDLYSKW